MKGERIWKASALALSVLAVAATLNTGLSAPRQREILVRKETALRNIQAYAGRWAREDALKNQLAAQQAWKPVDLDELAVRTLGANTAKITPRPATAAADGWQRREVSVEMREVPYTEAALFLAGAAETPPAWRLREIEIKPSAEAGKGGMTVVLEALEKKRP
jgi:hypothetical protein